jgi:hypothetical protein
MMLQLIPSNPLLLAAWAAHAFFAILFLQSGFDKLYNYHSNLGWIREQFKSTPISPVIVPVFISLTLMELASGMSAAACLYFLGTHDTSFSLSSFALCSGTLLALFFGQRISRNYEGAATLAAYFAVSLISLLFMHYLAM